MPTHPHTDPTLPAGSPRNAIDELFETVRAVVEHYDLRSLRSALSACEALVGDRAKLDVAVLGQFKSGKSSLLNALVGSDILPVGAVPVTAVVTRLVGGEGLALRVSYLDGRTESVGPERIGEFVTEARNPDNQRQVAVVDVELPALLPWPALRLVDTPGLSSTFGHNTQTTRDWLPNAAAALIVVSAERPLSEQDRNLIVDVRRQAPHTWIILSKFDLLNEDQRVEVAAFLQSQLRTFVDSDLPVIPFSIRQDRERCVDRLKQEIIRPLVEDPSRERATVFKHKVRTLAEACVAFLQIALQAASRANTDRDRLRAAIFDESVQESVLRSELALAAREMGERIRPALDKQFEAMIAPMSHRMTHALGNELTSWTGNLEKQTRRYETWLREHLTADLGNITGLGVASAQEIITEAEKRFRRLVEAFRDRLGRNLSHELNVSLTPVRWEVRMPGVVVPDPSYSRTFGTNWDLLWWAIPMVLFGPIVHRHFLKMIPWEVEKNVARLISDWYTAVVAAIDELQKQAYAWSQTELTTLQQLLDRQPDDAPSIRERITFLNSGLTAH